MRIAHLFRKYNPAEWGGTETALHRVFQALHPQGVESIVYAPRIRPAGTLRDPLAEAGCVIKRFRSCVPVLGLPPAEREQMIAVGGNLMSFSLPWLLWREPNLSVIHSHALGRLGGIGLTVAKWRGLPFIVTIHGGVLAIPASLRQSFDSHREGWEWGRAFGWLFNSRGVLAEADAILTCNHKEAELLRAKYPAKRILVQPHGVPLGQFSTDHREAALTAFPQLRGKQVLLVPGRIDPIKNQGWLIEQASRLLNCHPAAVLVLAGACTDKDYGAKVDTMIAASDCRARILLTGPLPAADPRLIGLFQQASAVVLASLSETFGLVVLESWAAGTPVLASRTPGAAALVRHKENGWLFDLDIPGDFHAGVDVLLSQSGYRQQWGAAGRQTVAAKYDSAVLARRLKELYEELCDLKAPARRRAPRLSSTRPELAHR